jgi:hypothetical protein
MSKQNMVEMKQNMAVAWDDSSTVVVPATAEAHFYLAGVRTPPHLAHVWGSRVLVTI